MDSVAVVVVDVVRTLLSYPSANVLLVLPRFASGYMLHQSRIRCHVHDAHTFLSLQACDIMEDHGFIS